MPTIPSATGPLDTAALGVTLMHEHVIVRSAGMYENWPHLFNRAEAVARSVDTLAEAKAHGIDTIVDLTTTDLGRDVAFVAEVAQKSGMQVIVATGMWWRPPQWFDRAPVDEVAALFIKDITEEIAGTGIRAAIIKVATDEPGVTPAIQTVLRAAARAHRATGVPISTHAHAALKRGLEQQAIFREEGVDLSRVIIGHSGDTEDTDFLKTLIGAGSVIGMDRFGIDGLLDTPRRVNTIARLCADGLAEKMVLAHDTNCHSDFPAAIRQRFPNWRFTHIPDDVLPMLRQAGVSQQQIDQMLVHTPRAIFERQGGY
jgi:phosphotriesterase-related protein